MSAITPIRIRDDSDRKKFSDLSSHKDCINCGSIFYRDKRNTWAHWARAKFCSRTCFGAYDARRKVNTRPELSTAFKKWFSETDGCWEWQGALDKDGYAIFSYAGKSYRASRISLRLDGRDPEGLMACHHCDNPRCVRPEHLFLGSGHDNMQDMVRKGRGPIRFGAKNPNYKHGLRVKETRDA